MRGLTAAILLLLGPLLPVVEPSGPPYSPQDALKTFNIDPAFQIELFAAEPLVADPVAMEIDENGRMYVVEMHGYPLDLGGTGKVVLLDDTNGDGKPDRRTTFAEGLRLPTGVMRWKTGVLVTDSPDVLYLEDTNGDGRADVKRVVLTGFALTNPQHTTNAPVYGLDNWIYIANEGPVRTIRYDRLFGDEGRAVHFPARPDAPTLPPDADGRNVRVRPDTFALEALSSRCQFGQTFDAWGHHFLNTNNRHLYQEVIAARYLARNPTLVVPTVVEQLPDYRLPAEIFPITDKPQFELLTDIGVMTSASGLTYYGAELFPPAYRKAAFVAEGAHNVVHVAALRDHGVTFRASRMHEGREFLASRDSWFRPVNFYLGPDGALYLLDYYRKILEHPEWLDEATANSSELYAGKDRGRIYRIVPRGTSAASWMGRIRLGEARVEDLVARLSDGNIWWRRHAQRLLVDRKPSEGVPLLSRLATNGESAVGRVHALWTLEGIGGLTTDVIVRALRDDVAGVRENAIKLAELRLVPAAHVRQSDLSGIVDALLALKDDSDPKVRFQLLLTLGYLDSADARATRNRLMMANVEDEWMQVAALTAVSLDTGALFRTAMSDLTQRETAGRRGLFNRIGTLIGGDSNPELMREVVRRVANTDAPEAGWWQASILEGIAANAPADVRRRNELDVERELLLSLALRARGAPVRRAALQVLERAGLPAAGASEPVLREAERLVANSSAEPEVRADAVRLLTLTGADEHAALLQEVLSRAEPAAVQVAAVRALGAVKGERIAASFVELWERWTRAVRVEAVKWFVREPERVRVLLDAVAAAKIRPIEIERPLRIRLMMAADSGLRARARSLFAASLTSPKAVVSRYTTTVESRHGDRDRGREVFARACATCHKYRGVGESAFGPDLGEVRNRLPPALVTDILHPNHSIADGYELWVVELSDGTVTGGVIGAETPTAVTFKLPGGGETTVARASIASMRIADSSAMPEGLEAQIDIQQMADLIAFIKGG